MELITGPPRHYHVSHDTTLELESAILSDLRVVEARGHPLVVRATAGIASATQRLGVDGARLMGAGKRVDTGENPSRDYFAVMMDLDTTRFAPWFVRMARKSVYLFDAWPHRHADIRSLVSSWGIQYAFVSSSQASEMLASVSHHCTFIWVPEGIDPARYARRSRSEKDIDVLQLGRKYDAHHALITSVLEKDGMRYLYERKKGELVFPTRNEFVEGLARSRISICLPSSVTHPERSGDIETVTARYLQSMISGCLVLGHAPEEMIELFGYNPVVEIEMGRAAGQIRELLATYEDYQPLIERNYQLVLERHTWKHRWERMAGILFGEQAPT